MPPAPFFVSYTGRSMNPTLVEPELLEIVPYGEAPLRVGDVVLFAHRADGAQLVHRIVRVLPRGLTTRGDNSTRDDEDVCPPSGVRGRVVAAWRGQRRRVIFGGRLGQWWAWSLRGRHLLLVVSVRLLSKPYHALARSGLVRQVVPAGLCPHVLVFQNEGARQFRLVIGRHVVGEYDLVRQAWHIRPPFLLFVDEASLPPGRP